jgi:Inhibitor of Apoptosis domain
MEDPTDDRLFEARKATFGSRWPHENKRGWVCKTEKMAAAGWHFAPTAECEDLVSCAYCNLSLDGWEPKDSPL